MNNYRNENNTIKTSASGGSIFSDSETVSYKFVTIVLVLIIGGLLVGIYFFITSNALIMSSITGTDIHDKRDGDSFDAKVSKGADILREQGRAEASLYFNELANTAEDPRQEGQAKLNLGYLRLRSDREGAVELLKEVSVNESYSDFTRAKAANYVLNEYTATKDTEFARAHIFTGPVWGGFSDENLEEAALNGFVYSVSISPTPEANMRIAFQYAIQIISGSLTVEEMDEVAELALGYIEQGNRQITDLTESGRIKYGDTHISEIVSAMNRRSMALDSLYFAGYVDKSEVVKESFRETLEVLIDNSDEVSSGTELFVRNNYADFLVRLDSEQEAENIKKILAPMVQMESTHNIAGFLRDRIQDTAINDQRSPKAPGRPDSILTMTKISEDYREALLRIGVSEEILSAEQ